MLVTPQRVPADLVRPTVTASIIERLNSISQEIMSRTRLEQIIDELKLYQNELKQMKREEVVELMRKNIKVELPRRTSETTGYFTVGYTGEDPRTVTIVANKLSSLFIEENLKLREQQAVGTTEFLTNELQATKEKLEVQGKTLADYKRRNMGSLPEQRDTNIKMLEQTPGPVPANRGEHACPRGPKASHYEADGRHGEPACRGNQPRRRHPAEKGDDELRGAAGGTEKAACRSAVALHR